MFLFRHKLVKQNDGNGDYVDFTYDSFDRQTQKQYNGDNNQRVTYSYGNNGSVAQITDHFTNSNTRFTYDLAERVVSQREYSGTAKNGGELLSYTDFTYADKTNYLTGIKHFSPLGTQNIGYTFGVQKDGEMPDQIYKVTWNGAEKVTYKYDNLGRLESKHTDSFDTDFTYEDVTVNDDQRTTTLVKSVATPTGTYTYTYDKLGNILSVTDGTYTTSYEYDSLNQLTRVNDEKAGKTYTYSYTNGNITEQNEYDYTVGIDALIDPNNTKTWEYNDSTWSDLLTNYNGTPITYDEIGNPLTIGEKSLTWTGRQLQSITDGDTEIAYTYNGDGLRTSKTVNGETTNYYYNGSILTGQKSGDDTLVFMYDNNSDIFGFIYNNTEYYYIKNAQNDVIAIADKDGKVALKYSYDAWGKVISITDRNGNDINNLKINKFDPNTGEIITEYDENGNVIVPVHPYVRLAHINPILYRSYYYDKETGWYYLNTRYYSPDMCRFINADDVDVLKVDQGNLYQFNLYTYCLNNPFNRIDIEGNLSVSTLFIGSSNIVTGLAAIGAGVAVLACGVATPVMIGIAAVTVVAGVLTTANGVSDIGEGFTGNNIIKDTIFQGNNKAYNTYSAITATTAMIGSFICDGWIVKNAPRIQAYNNIQNYKYTKTISDTAHMKRPYNNSLLLQRYIIKYGKMKKDSFGYVFYVSGKFNKRTALWRLGVNNKKQLIWHFGHGF